MALATAILVSDAAALVADLPSTATISGSDYQCTRTELGRTQVLIDEGLRDQYRFSILLPLTASGLITDTDGGTASPPALKTTLTISSTTYRILAGEKDEADTLYRLDLGEEYA